MPVVDELITRLNVDDKGAMPTLTAMQQKLKAVYGHVQAIVQGAMVAAGAIGALGAAVIGAARQAGEFEALVAGLASVEGSADKAARQVAKLREIAKQPGLGVAEAITGFSGLRRAGIDEGTAFRLVRELGNQNAQAGGGKAELAGLLLVFQQIANKGRLQGEEALQLAERGIPIYQLLARAFGTSDTEALMKKGVGSDEIIAGLLEQMEKMPRVAGGIKNAFENIMDAAEQALVAIGTGAAGAGLIGGIGALSAAIEKATENGTMQMVGRELSNLFMTLTGMKGSGAEVSDRLTNIMIEIGAVAAVLAHYTEGIPEAIKRMMGIQEWFGTHEIVAQRKRIRDELEMDRQLADARRRRDERNAAMEDDTKPGGPVSQQTQALIAIEENTRKMVELTRAAFGGGDLGAMGISRVDLSMMGGNTPATRIARSMVEIGSLYRPPLQSFVR